MIERFSPQTCAQSKTIAPTVEQAIAILQREGWFFELKLDGVRAIAYVEDGVVTLINRRMADITGRYPEIVTALALTFPTGSYAFDGEIVCYGDDEDEQGRWLQKPDFTRIHKRDAQPVTKTAVIAQLAREWPATFVAFDVLHNDGDDLRGVPYAGRRHLLQSLFGQHVEGSSTLQAIVSETDGEALWQFTTQHGLEGLIAKQKASTYRGGRSSAWVKLKKVDSVSCVAVGYDIGEGSRAGTIGAIHLALIDSGTVVPVGRVGTGFKDRDLVDLKARIDGGQMLVLEIEYANWGATTKKLRFPSYKGIRTDVAVTSCTIDQLNPALRLGDAQVEALVSR